MVRWHHWLDGHEFESTLGVDDWHGSLACCSPWCCRVWHDRVTELNWTDCISWNTFSYYFLTHWSIILFPLKKQKCFHLSLKILDQWSTETLHTFRVLFFGGGSFFWWIWFGRTLICHFLIVSEYTKHLNFSAVSLIPWVLRLLEHAPQTSICFIYPPTFFKIICGPFFKSLLNLLQYCFCFMFWYFGHEACGILAPPPWISDPPPALEGEVLTTGLPGKVKVTQSCPTLCDPMDHTINGILQARILEWVAFPFSRESSQPRNQTQVPPIAGRFFTSWATREAQEY